MPHDNDPQDPFRQSIGQLATAIEDRPLQQVDEAPQTHSNRQVYWLIAGLCAVVIAAVEVGVMMRSDAADVPAPPPQVESALQNNSCLARTRAIVNAVGRYADAHGGPPPTLATLGPQYLPFAPIDPASNQPLGYQVIGESVTVSCPSAARGAASAGGGSGS